MLTAELAKVAGAVATAQPTHKPHRLKQQAHFQCLRFSVALFRAVGGNGRAGPSYSHHVRHIAQNLGHSLIIIMNRVRELREQDHCCRSGVALARFSGNPGFHDPPVMTPRCAVELPLQQICQFCHVMTDVMTEVSKSDDKSLCFRIGQLQRAFQKAQYMAACARSSQHSLDEALVTRLLPVV